MSTVAVVGRLTAFSLLVGIATAASAAERPSAARLLPDTTVVMLTVPNAPEAVEHFMNTAMGRMSQDPQLKPLVGHLYGSLSQVVTEAQEKIGLSLPELLSLPQGEITFAVVAVKESRPAIVLLIEAKDQIANARRLIEKGQAALEQANAEKTEKEIDGVTLTTYQMQGRRQRRASFFEKDSTIVAGTDPDVLERLLATWNGEKLETLADNFSYSAIMTCCRSDEEAKPHVIAYVDPIGIMRAMEQGNAGLTLALAMLPTLGLDGLGGLGGTLALDVGHYDSLLQLHVLLDTPRAGVLQAVALEPVDLQPERWVPADVASYMTLRWNIDSSFRTAASLHDSIRGEGSLSRLINDRIGTPTGIDLEKDILPELDGRITMLTCIARPVTLTSQHQLVALKLKDSAPVEKALETLLEKFPDWMSVKESAGKKYYRVNVPVPQREDAPPPPDAGYAVLDGYLLVANQTALIEKLIGTLAGGKLLADELDFKLAVSRVKRQAGDLKPAMIAFERPEEGMRYLYELAGSEQIRGQLARGAERNRFFRSVNSALEENPLPPFAVVERYLAPSVAFAVNDDTGIHYTALTLRRKAD